MTVRELTPGREWTPVDVDLDAYRGEIVHVRFVFHAQPSAGRRAADFWRLADVRVAIGR